MTKRIRLDYATINSRWPVEADAVLKKVREGDSELSRLPPEAMDWGIVWEEGDLPTDKSLDLEDQVDQIMSRIQPRLYIAKYKGYRWNGDMVLEGQFPWIMVHYMSMLMKETENA